MNIIILAAGQGTRLRPYTNVSVSKYDGESLLEDKLKLLDPAD